jgi:hypothetical protein
MTFFSAASVRSAVFCFVLAAKGQRGDKEKFFVQKTLKRSAAGRFCAKNLLFHISGIPLPIERKIAD